MRVLLSPQLCSFVYLDLVAVGVKFEPWSQKTCRNSQFKKNVCFLFIYLLNYIRKIEKAVSHQQKNPLYVSETLHLRDSL